MTAETLHDLARAYLLAVVLALFLFLCWYLSGECCPMLDRLLSGLGGV